MNLLDIAAAAVPLAAVYGGTFVYSRTARARVSRALTAIGLTHDMHVKSAADGGPYGVLTADVNTVMPIDLWRARAPELAKELSRHTPKITRRTGGVRLQFLPAPAGAEAPPPEMLSLTAWDSTPPKTPPTLRGLPVARDAYGNTWRMPVLGAHWLILGATGSGKGSVMWALINQLAPHVHDGTVQLWGIDPKGGVELGYGEPLFTRLAYNGADAAAWETDLSRLLADARQAMDARLERMRGTSRLHTPTTAEPLIVLIVDEFLTLTLGIADRNIKQQIDRDLTMILSKGRAPGVTVIACAQLAQKDALSAGIRDLFPYRVGLRMTDAEQARMALGSDAVRKGAECHRIPDNRPGAAYVVAESGYPAAVRFPWTSDEQITSLARRYGRKPARLVIPAGDPPTLKLPVVPAPTPEPEPETSEEIIRRLLTEEPHLTQAEMARQAGCSDRYVRKIRDQVRRETADALPRPGE